MTNALGVAVIGAGMAGRAHAHGYRSAGTVFSAGLPPVRLVSVADINEDLARDTARRYGFERHDTSWEAIVKAEDINVVSVVVANHLHREMITELAAAGKHVLCEKPLAPSSTDARAMIDAVAAAGVVARIGFTYRWSPGIGAVREQLIRGQLGRPLYFSGQYWTDYACDQQVPMSWRYRGDRIRGARGPRQPPHRCRRVHARTDRLSAWRCAHDRDCRPAGSARTRSGACPRRSERSTGKGRER